MDTDKCNALKTDLAAQPEPQIVSIERFFDGNDDLGSIGCNLLEHPGIPIFRTVLLGLLARSDVRAVYAQIGEFDPGEDSWPFADTVFVAGTIPPAELEAILRPLQPDEVGSAAASDGASVISERHDAPVLAVWWD